MVKVIAWPPVALSGWELRKHHPTSASRNVFGGPDRVSTYGAPRYLATAIVPGIGKDLAAAGWVEMLVDQMQGRVNLVRVPSLAPLWALHDKGRNPLVNQVLEWTADGTELLWTASGDPLIWSTGRTMYGEPATDSGWPAITVTGLPAGVTIRPSEFITVRSDSAEQERRVLSLVKANAAGEAMIRLDEAFTINGLVSIGERKSIVFQALDIPREVQGLGGQWAFTWNFRQVFESEFPTAFEEVDPWR